MGRGADFMVDRRSGSSCGGIASALNYIHGSDSQMRQTFVHGLKNIMVSQISVFISNICWLFNSYKKSSLGTSQDMIANIQRKDPAIPNAP